MLVSNPADKFKNLKEKQLIYLEDNFCFQMSEDIVKQCLEYAQGKAKYNDYLVKYRGANPLKLIDQDSYSKLAEFAAQEFIQLCGLKAETYQVDTKIYTPSQKSWSADLGGKIAVKSTSRDMVSYISRNRPGAQESWTFQFKNKNAPGGVDKEIFSPGQNNEQWVILATVSQEKITPDTNIWIRSFIKLNRARELMQEPIKLANIGRTKCIYDDDLKRYQKELVG